MFGSHLSISGGLHNALLKAEELGCATVQVFTKNQQQWKCTPLEQGVIGQWDEHRKRIGFTKTVSHDSYLINLASPDAKLRGMSVDLFAEELRKRFRLPVHLWDERLTSAEANRLLRETDLSIEKRGKAVDRMAAVLILQGWMERRGN